MQLYRIHYTTSEHTQHNKLTGSISPIFLFCIDVECHLSLAWPCFPPPPVSLNQAEEAPKQIRKYQNTSHWAHMSDNFIKKCVSGYILRTAIVKIWYIITFPVNYERILNLKTVPLVQKSACPILVTEDITHWLRWFIPQYCGLWVCPREGMREAGDECPNCSVKGKKMS